MAAISKEFPVPYHPLTREIRVVLATIKKGPKAKMPEHLLLEGEDFGPLPITQGLIAPNTHLKPVAQPEHHPIMTNVAATVAAARQPTFSAGASTALQNLIQSVQTNATNPLAALLNIQHATAPLPPAPAPAPGADVAFNNILLQALQQNNFVRSTEALPTVYHQSNYTSRNSFIDTAPQLVQSMATPNLGQLAFSGARSAVGQQPSPDSIIRVLQQNAQAVALSNMMNNMPATNAPQLQHLSTEQLQALLKKINQP